MRGDKAALRSQFVAYRRSLSEQSYESLGGLIVARLVKIPEITSASTVHVYWPMVARREVDTRSFIRWLQDHQKQIVLPVVTNFAMDVPGTSRLVHVRYPGEENLRPNRWGISEPGERHPVAIDDLDVIVVPALGADHSGHRVGYGYGYYDEFLAQTDAPKIALLYEACLVDTVLSETYDVPMNVLVTERNLIRPRESTAADD